MASLRKEFDEGYCSAKDVGNPFIYSSPSYYAWNLGQWFKLHEMPLPKAVAMSRGYTIKADSQVFNCNKIDEALKTQIF